MHLEQLASSSRSATAPARGAEVVERQILQRLRRAASPTAYCASARPAARALCGAFSIRCEQLRDQRRDHQQHERRRARARSDEHEHERAAAPEAAPSSHATSGSNVPTRISATSTISAPSSADRGATRPRRSAGPSGSSVGEISIFRRVTGAGAGIAAAPSSAVVTRGDGAVIGAVTRRTERGRRRGRGRSEGIRRVRSARSVPHVGHRYRRGGWRRLPCAGVTPSDSDRRHRAATRALAATASGRRRSRRYRPSRGHGECTSTMPWPPLLAPFRTPSEDLRDTARSISSAGSSTTRATSSLRHADSLRDDISTRLHACRLHAQLARGRDRRVRRDGGPARARDRGVARRRRPADLARAVARHDRRGCDRDALRVPRPRTGPRDHASRRARAPGPPEA